MKILVYSRNFVCVSYVRMCADSPFKTSPRSGNVKNRIDGFESIFGIYANTNFLNGQRKIQILCERKNYSIDENKLGQ